MVKNTHIISMLKINNLRVSNCRALREYGCHNNHLTNQLIDHLTRSELAPNLWTLNLWTCETLNRYILLKEDHTTICEKMKIDAK